MAGGRCVIGKSPRVSLANKIRISTSQVTKATGKLQNWERKAARDTFALLQSRTFEISFFFSCTFRPRHDFTFNILFFSFSLFSYRVPHQRKTRLLPTRTSSAHRPFRHIEPARRAQVGISTTYKEVPVRRRLVIRILFYFIISFYFFKAWWYFPAAQYARAEISSHPFLVLLNPPFASLHLTRLLFASFPYPQPSTYSRHRDDTCDA